MNQAEVIEVGRQGLIILMKVGAPIMTTALPVGLSVSLVQALTQIQEMTLAFVPKILVIFLSLVLFMPFMMSTMIGFGNELFAKIVALD